MVPGARQCEVLSGAPAEDSLNLLVGFVTSFFALGNTVKDIGIMVWL